MKAWQDMTNDELAKHLELWLDIDGKVTTAHQTAFFEEVLWRLMFTNSPFFPKEIPSDRSEDDRSEPGAD